MDTRADAELVARLNRLLPAMVGLVVEKVRQQERDWITELSPYVVHVRHRAAK